MTSSRRRDGAASSKTECQQEELLYEKKCKESPKGASSTTRERISAITLNVADLARSVHIYNEFLGLEVI
jgi:catechol-2,3-dioxygenase